MNNGELVSGSWEDEDMDHRGGTGIGSCGLRNSLESGELNQRDFGIGISFRKYDKSLTAHTAGKIEEIKKFINENYLDNISREDLASAFDMSPDHLSRMFLKHTGKRISAYVCKLRIYEASRRLLNSGDAVIRIAHDTGFGSLRTFNRSFFERMGMAPSQYRKLRTK